METNEETVDKQYIKGELQHLIFHNAAEHFSIAKIKVLETNTDMRDKEIVIKGYFSNLQEGKAYQFYGHFEHHVKFGTQYHVTSYQPFVPDTKDGLIAYLSSDLFYGIGKKTAQRMLDTLGEQAISKILNDPGVLNRVPGLHKDAAKNVVKVLQENQGFDHVVVQLSEYGIGLKMAQKIYHQYKEDTIHLLEQDPYQFVFDIDGFGFQTADEIGRLLNLSLVHPNRIGAGCVYVLQKNVKDGHVFVPLDSCVNEVKQLLYRPMEPLEDETIIQRLAELNKEKRLIIQEERVYLPSLYYAEDGFASHVQRLLSQTVEEVTTTAELMQIIGDIEEEESLSYGKEQFEAIENALQKKLMVLTGGPGTGKTTVIKGILKAYAQIHDKSLEPSDYEDRADYPFVLAAPTGRAAKRITESTGLPAFTIHRLLGWDGKDGFEKNEFEQLKGAYLIVDEFSMVDIWLANQLFKAIPDDMQVLLVGDEDQLPSVGPGQVLADMLGNDQIPYVSLHEVYRQQEGSKIIQLAHQIKNNDLKSNSLDNDKDFSFIACQEYQVVDVITKVYAKALHKGIDDKDIQVLAPMYRSRAGITEINKALQALVNPKTRQKREVHVQDAIFRVGDKVIQLVNQPEDGVYNGDIGKIVAIFRENENAEQIEQLVVAFEDREVVYERKDYINIMHAYCISIHKAQGSEFPIVLMPIVSAYYRMLRKNLLYTGITRGKQSLIICGEQDAFLRGVQTIDTNRRNTYLQEQLLERLGSNQVDSEEEADMSPYDFM